MHDHDLHRLLTETLSLIPQPVRNAVSTTYFHQQVSWHPRCSTRVVRVLYGAAGDVARIQLCVSSDNNNVVLLAPPFEEDHVRARVTAEIELLQSRRAA